MKRSLFAWSLIAAVACTDVSNPLPPTLMLSPIVDSLFVGDDVQARHITYYNSDGVIVNPGPTTWSIAPDSVATINATTGVIHGVAKGIALVTASAGGAQGFAVVVVSRTLDLTLLMDTLVLMQNDTFTIPVAVVKKNPLAIDTVWFDPSPSPNVTMNTANGFVTAVTSGGAVRYVAHVTTGGVDTVSDTGGVVVLALNDTVNAGHFFQTVLGTAIRHQGGPSWAINYARSSTRLAFQLSDSAIADSAHFDTTTVIVNDSVIGPATFNIDSISPQEVGGALTLSPMCGPRFRPWASWVSVLPIPGITALSHSNPPDSVSGSIAITQYVPLPSGGAIVSGRYVFVARRTDLYSDPLGAETIRGTFVAPLVTRRDTCQF